MSEKDEMEVSESQIAVHWMEEDYLYPPRSSSPKRT